MDHNQASRTNTSSVSIDIPRFERVLESSGKEYTVYKVIIAKPGGSKEIEKRYRQFDQLHRNLQKSEELPRNIEFPPKRLNPSFATKEERRGKLKTYLQELCDMTPIPAAVLEFLDISQPVVSNLVNSRTMDSSSEDLLDSVKYSSYTHQPLLGFTKDPYTFDIQGDIQENILTDSILDGIYDDSSSSSCYFMDVR